MKERVNHPTDYVEEHEREMNSLSELFDKTLKKQRKECNTYLFVSGIVNVGLLILLGIEWGIL